MILKHSATRTQLSLFPILGCIKMPFCLQDLSVDLKSPQVFHDISTTVINVKVEHIRPRFANLRSWCADSNHVYIGRRGVVFINKVRFPERDSVWANPFKVGKGCSREKSISDYEAHIRGRLAKDESLRAALRGLRGKVLGCWCRPLACHGDVLLRLLEEEEQTLLSKRVCSGGGEGGGGSGAEAKSSSNEADT